MRKHNRISPTRRLLAGLLTVCLAAALSPLTALADAMAMSMPAPTDVWLTQEGTSFFVQWTTHQDEAVRVGDPDDGYAAGYVMELYRKSDNTCVYQTQPTLYNSRWDYTEQLDLSDIFKDQSTDQYYARVQNIDMLYGTKTDTVSDWSNDSNTLNVVAGQATNLPVPTDVKIVEENGKLYVEWNSHRDTFVPSGDDDASYDIYYNFELYRVSEDSPRYSIGGTNEAYLNATDPVRFSLDSYFNDDLPEELKTGGYYCRVQNVEMKDYHRTGRCSDWSNYSAALWLGEDQSAVNTIDIHSASLYYLAGETPKATAWGDDFKYTIVYERWEEMEKQADGTLEPVAFWYSDESQYRPNTPRITTFQAGKTYMYSLFLETKYGYVFPNDVKMELNGQQPKYAMLIVGNNGTTCFADVLYSFVPEEPIPVKTIDIIEINNVTTSFHVGDAPRFTGVVADDAPYSIDHEGWETDGSGWTSSDYWNSRYGDEEGSWGKPLTAFEAGKTYTYRVCFGLSANGYRNRYQFDPEKTKLKINGQLISFSDPDQVSIDEDGESAWFSAALTMTPSSAMIAGDVDGSGTVQAADALLALKAATGSITLSAAQQTCADVDGQPGVTVIDALMILETAAGKITLTA